MSGLKIVSSFASCHVTRKIFNMTIIIVYTKVLNIFIECRIESSDEKCDGSCLWIHMEYEKKDSWDPWKQCILSPCKQVAAESCRRMWLLCAYYKHHLVLLNLSFLDISLKHYTRWTKLSRITRNERRRKGKVPLRM